MSDVFDRSKRSQIMQAVKSSNNRSTELKLLATFKKLHITGWRRSYPLYGKPDITFPKRRIAIFIDGCFWHGHNCRNTHPKDNEEYWQKKQKRNVQRDIEVTERLQKKNWLVIRIWECELNKGVLPEKLIPFFATYSTIQMDSSHLVVAKQTQIYDQNETPEIDSNNTELRNHRI